MTFMHYCSVLFLYAMKVRDNFHSMDDHTARQAEHNANLLL